MPFKLALITGASRGLGMSLASHFAKEGVDLILVARDPEKLKELALSLSSYCKITYFALDLSKIQDRNFLIDQIHKLMPDLVINNAGFGMYGDTLCHFTKETLSILEVNATALTEITIESARVMVERSIKGTILNISSAAAFHPMPSFAVYAASKAYVNAFSQAVAYEYKPFGIQVLTSCPGPIKTSFGARASGGFRRTKATKTLDVDNATKILIRQIKKGIPLTIFPFIYKIMTLLSKLIPSFIINKMIKKEIDSYHNCKEILPPCGPYGRH